MEPKQMPAGDANVVSNKLCPESREYETFIDQAARFAYAPQRLGNISELKNKYNCQIHSTADAVKYAGEALKVFDDPFSKVLTPAGVTDVVNNLLGTAIGTGIQYYVNDSVGQNLNHLPLLIDRVYPDSPAEKAGLRVGDRIYKVDNEDVTQMTSQDARNLLKDHADKTSDLEVQSYGDTDKHNIEVTQTHLDIPLVEDKDLGRGIAYIALDTLADQDAPAKMAEAMSKHKNARAYILDLRCNLGGIVPESLSIASMFIKNGVIMSTQERYPSAPNQPQYLNSVYQLDNTKMVIESTLSTPKNLLPDTVQNEDNRISLDLDHPLAKSAPEFKRQPYLAGDKPIVVLVNSQTASAAEILTGALHDTAGATTIGEKTFGKGIGQRVQMVDLPGGAGEEVTTLRYFTPNGFWPGDAYNHRNGIKPDLEVVNPDNAAPLSPKDAQMNAAIQYLENKLGAK